MTVGFMTSTPATGQVTVWHSVLWIHSTIVLVTVTIDLRRDGHNPKKQMTLANQMRPAGCRSVFRAGTKCAMLCAGEVGSRRARYMTKRKDTPITESSFEGKVYTAAVSLEHLLLCAHIGLRL